MTRLDCAGVVIVGLSLVLFPLAGTDLRAETNALPFYENFEPTPPAPATGGGWGFRTEWHAYDAPANHWTDCLDGTIPPDLAYCPDDPSVVFIEPTTTYGPYKMETWPDKDNGGKVFSGQRSARQPIWDPMWSAFYHIFTPPVGTGTLRLKAQLWDEAGKLCDCDQEKIRQFGYPTYVCDCSTPGPYPPPPATPVPSRANFDDNAGIELTNPDRSEYFAMGVNTHRSWTNYCWVTKADGWVVSNVPRTKGWRKMEIVVHPYTGNVGDVEFLMNGVVVAQGRRMPGTGSGVDLSYLRLGGDPAIITESSFTNTFEEFWYDEVALTYCNRIRPDADGDEDVDQDDFGVFQRCWTGSGNPFYQIPTSMGGWDDVNRVWLGPILFDAAQCQCMDMNGDQAVDLADFDRFVACASGPSVPASSGCDN